MSHSSVVGQVGGAVHNAVNDAGGALTSLATGGENILSGGGLINNWYKSLVGGAPSPTGPTAAPTTQNATQTSLDQQLQNEMQLRASRTLFSTPSVGGSLLDNPTPASRILLGGF